MDELIALDTLPSMDGSYSIINLDTNKVLHIELVQVKQHNLNHFVIWFCVQSNEVKSSNHMEKEGLLRAFDFLAQ